MGADQPRRPWDLLHKDDPPPSSGSTYGRRAGQMPAGLLVRREATTSTSTKARMSMGSPAGSGTARKRDSANERAGGSPVGRPPTLKRGVSGTEVNQTSTG
jgi:hypothetical protein